MNRLRHAYGRSVRAPPGYWVARRHARYGVLIGLGPLGVPPKAMAVPRQYGSAWLVLRDD